MIATVDFVEKTFERFNELCFEGILPQVPVVLTKAGTFLGKMEYRQKRNFFGKVVSHSDYRLKISTGFDLSESELEDIVIHEMIHYYIAYRRLSDTSVHGTTFRRIMGHINTSYGRNVSVRHKGRPEQNLVRGQNGAVRTNHICISTFPDGKFGITVCTPAKAPELRRLLPRYYGLAKMEWFESTDTFFNRYPRSRTPKIYKITESELASARIRIRQG